PAQKAALTAPTRKQRRTARRTIPWIEARSSAVRTWTGFSGVGIGRRFESSRERRRRNPTACRSNQPGSCGIARRSCARSSPPSPSRPVTREACTGRGLAARASRLWRAAGELAQDPGRLRAVAEELLQVDRRLRFLEVDVALQGVE